MRNRCLLNNLGLGKTTGALSSAAIKSCGGDPVSLCCQNEHVFRRWFARISPRYSAKDTGVKESAPKTLASKRTTRSTAAAWRSRRLRRLPQATAPREFVRAAAHHRTNLITLLALCMASPRSVSRSKGSSRSLLSRSLSLPFWMDWMDDRAGAARHTRFARNSTRLPISSISGCAGAHPLFLGLHEMKSSAGSRRLFSRSPRRCA